MQIAPLGGKFVGTNTGTPLFVFIARQKSTLFEPLEVRGKASLLTARFPMALPGDLAAIVTTTERPLIPFHPNPINEKFLAGLPSYTQSLLWPGSENTSIFKQPKIVI